MRQRHKTPSLVSMWMLDVFCCALGCVTLLWLLKTREADQAFQDATDSTQLLESTRSDLEKLKVDFETLTRQLATTESERNEKARRLAFVEQNYASQAQQLATTESKLDATTQQLALVKEKADANAKELAVVEKRADTSATELAKTRTQAEAGAKELALTRTKADEMAKELARDQAKLAETAQARDAARKEASDAAEMMGKKQAELKTLARSVEEQRAKLDELERLVREKEAARVAAAEKSDAMSKSLAGMDASKNRADITEKELAAAKAQIVDLQTAKTRLNDQLSKVEVDNEKKFAGIAMTGKRVVFILDISGSMTFEDGDHLDPNKWPFVRESLVKVMRTLPTLEKFQVLLFSSSVEYLIAGNNGWIDYKGEESLEKVRRALGTVKPQGDTNLHLAFEEAFRYRDRGLDTIYLLSDGLPTTGPVGIIPQQNPPLTDAARSRFLSSDLRNRIAREWNAPRANLARVRINSVGFYFESPDVGAFLWALSRENDGAFVGMAKP